MPRFLKFAIHVGIVIGAICVIMWLISGRAGAYAIDAHSTPTLVWQSYCDGRELDIAPRWSIPSPTP
jgi:hypothetical protein